MSSSAWDFLSYQPFKALFTILYITYNAPRLVFWLFYYIIPAFRPHPSWSHKQAVRVKIVRAFLYNASMVEMKTPLSLLPGKEKDRWVVISPAKSSVYVDAANCDPEVKPEKIGLTWYPRIPTKAEAAALASGNKLCILHFHGGAYAIGDGRTADAGFAAKTLLENSQASFVAAPQYRLVSNPGCRFPSQLQDGITSYNYLLNEIGVPANRIVLSGDSAGANLALALTRYVTFFGKQTSLPTPAANLQWSCWVNPGTSVRMGVSTATMHPNGFKDYVGGNFGLWGARRMTPSSTSGHDIHSPWISFLHNAFETPVPLYFSTGECELLFNDDIALAEQFSKFKSNKVELQIEEHAVHDVILVGAIIGFEKEAAQGVRRAAKWLEEIGVVGGSTSANGSKL